MAVEAKLLDKLDAASRATLAPLAAACADAVGPEAVQRYAEAAELSAVRAAAVGVQVEDTRICVVMVGLPARGKSLIAQKGTSAS